MMFVSETVSVRSVAGNTIDALSAPMTIVCLLFAISPAVSGIGDATYANRSESNRKIVETLTGNLNFNQIPSNTKRDRHESPIEILSRQQKIFITTSGSRQANRNDFGRDDSLSPIRLGKERPTQLRDSELTALMGFLESVSANNKWYPGLTESRRPQGRIEALGGHSKQTDFATDTSDVLLREKPTPAAPNYHGKPERVCQICEDADVQSRPPFPVLVAPIDVILNRQYSALTLN